jgi:hypothetical protein
MKQERESGTAIASVSAILPTASRRPSARPSNQSTYRTALLGQPSMFGLLSGQSGTSNLSLRHN